MNDTTGFIFEWDDEKAKANIKKHHVSFHEGVTVFNDPDMATLDDPDHSNDEDRYRIFLAGKFISDKLYL